MAAIHETMEALHEVGAVDTQTLRDFDEACLTPVIQITREEIRALRKRERLSCDTFIMGRQSAALPAQPQREYR